MVEKSELIRVPAFADLPDDQLDWFLSQAQELHLKAGETYLRAGDPANAMFVILEGQLEIRGEIGGETVAFAIDAGNVTGALPFSRMKTFTVGGRALVDTRALKFSADLFPELMQKRPELAKAPGGSPRGASAGSELEEQGVSLLRSHGPNDLWQLAADLARKNVKPEVLESLFAALDHGTARAALVRIAASVEIGNLLNEIESSTSRISDLVGAIKEYTYMDQSPVQNVDIVKSLETTLIILNHKLKRGVEVQRDYQPIPFLVNSFGSELNQVWTNIIDNAIDAMGGKGELRLRTYQDDGCVVVEIGDNGPGISPEVEAHIFEPFFTTKGVGQGTGLGLDTVQRIVKKHRGNIQVDSKPGDTRFQVWLPLAEASILPQKSHN